MYWQIIINHVYSFYSWYLEQITAIVTRTKEIADSAAIATMYKECSGRLAVVEADWSMHLQIKLTVETHKFDNMSNAYEQGVNKLYNKVLDDYFTY